MGVGFILFSFACPIRENDMELFETRKNDRRIGMELTINNLSKEYGKKKAVRCFNATLTNGVYGLLGAITQNYSYAYDM